MAEVKVYSKLIRGSEHVHSSTRDEGACILFVPHIEVDGHRIRTETAEGKAWRELAISVGVSEDAHAPSDAWPQPTISMGEGFIVLTIQHADDETWKFLSRLPDDAYGEGSTREEFYVLVTHLEYIPLEPDDNDPWLSPDKPSPLSMADLERVAG